MANKTPPKPVPHPSISDKQGPVPEIGKFCCAYLPIKVLAEIEIPPLARAKHLLSLQPFVGFIVIVLFHLVLSQR